MVLMGNSMDEWKKPREYVLASPINHILTVPINPETGEWIAFLPPHSVGAQSGYTEGEAILALIESLVKSKES